MLKNQKAAMFGLDARIALAIFGALSIITGAALYKAIQNAHSEQWRQYFESITKASEHYYLSTGVQLPMNDPTYGSIKIGNLMTNYASVNSWTGPYLSITGTITENSIKDSMTAKLGANSSVSIILQQVSTWSGIPNNISITEKCVLNNADCIEWIALSLGTGGDANNFQQLFDSLDDLVDGGDGGAAGKVRFNSANDGWILYQGMPRKQTS